VPAPSVVAGTFSWDRKTTITVNDLSVDYRGAHVTGDVAFDTRKGGVHSALAFDVKNLGVLPLPVDARGPLTGRVTLDLDGTTDIDVSLKSSVLYIEGTQLEDLAGTAKGSLENAKIDVTARTVAQEGIGHASGLTVSAGLGSVDGTTRIAFTKLALRIGQK